MKKPPENVHAFYLKHIALPNVLKNKAPFGLKSTFTQWIWERLFPALCLTYKTKMVKHDKEYDRVYYSITFYTFFRKHTVNFTLYYGYMMGRMVMSMIKAGATNLGCYMYDPDYTGETLIPAWAFKYVLEDLYILVNENKLEIEEIDKEFASLVEDAPEQPKPTLH